MSYPKIVYNPGTGPVTLAFTYPPVQKPGVTPLQATRHDSVTCSGKVQTVTERIDELQTLQLDWVPMADLAAWKAFMQYALTGGAFDYYPDAALGAHDSLKLDADSWEPVFAVRGFAKFKLAMRKVVA